MHNTEFPYQKPTMNREMFLLILHGIDREVEGASAERWYDLPANSVTDLGDPATDTVPAPSVVPTITVRATAKDFQDGLWRSDLHWGW